MMTFTDKTLTCCECAQAFTFTADEQAFFYLRGLKNDPRRCKKCKAKQSGRPRRPLIETRVYCSACRKETTVPFVPRQSRPVLCRDCFTAKNGPPVPRSTTAVAR